MVQTSNKLFPSFTQTPLKWNKSVQANSNFSNLPNSNNLSQERIDELKKSYDDKDKFLDMYCKTVALLGFVINTPTYIKLRKITLINNRSNLYLVDIFFAGMCSLFAYTNLQYIR